MYWNEKPLHSAQWLFFCRKVHLLYAISAHNLIFIENDSNARERYRQNSICINRLKKNIEAIFRKPQKREKKIQYST